MTCRPQDSRTSGRLLAPHPARGPREVGRLGRPKPSALRAQRLRKEGARLVPRTPPPPPPCAWVQLRWAGASPPALAALSAVRTPGTGGVGLSWGQGQSLTRSGRRSGRGLSPWKRPPTPRLQRPAATSQSKKGPQASDSRVWRPSHSAGRWAPCGAELLPCARGPARFRRGLLAGVFGTRGPSRAKSWRSASTQLQLAAGT